MIGNNSFPKIDVVIPAYNAEKYIHDTIRSVLCHNMLVGKVIVVDDGSTDGTHTLIVDEWGGDERVVLIHQKNGGVSAARNLGMRAGLSEYCYFMDADDILLSNFSDDIVSAIISAEVTPDVIALAASQFADATQEPTLKHFASVPHISASISGSDYVTLAIEQGVWSPCVWQYIWSRELLAGAGARFETGLMHEDDIFSLPTLWQAEQVITCDVPVYAYRRRSASLVGAARGEESIRGCLRAIEVYETLIEQKGKGKRASRRERAAILTRIRRLVEISVETSISMKREGRPGKGLMDLADKHRRHHVSIGQMLRMRWPGLQDLREALLRRLGCIGSAGTGV